TAGEPVVDGLIVIVESVDHHHVRSDGAGGFVHVAIEGDVGVGVDDAGSEIFAAGVNDRDPGRCVNFRTDSGDLAVLNVDAPVGNVAVSGSHDDGVLDEDIGEGRRGRVLGDGSEGDCRDDENRQSYRCGLAGETKLHS